MMPGQMPGMMPGQMPGMMPGQMPGMMPGQMPGMSPHAAMMHMSPHSVGHVDGTGAVPGTPHAAGAEGTQPQISQGHVALPTAGSPTFGEQPGVAAIREQMAALQAQLQMLNAGAAGAEAASLVPGSPRSPAAPQTPSSDQRLSRGMSMPMAEKSAVPSAAPSQPEPEPEDPPTAALARSLSAPRSPGAGSSSSAAAAAAAARSPSSPATGAGAGGGAAAAAPTGHVLGGSPTPTRPAVPATASAEASPSSGGFSLPCGGYVCVLSWAADTLFLSLSCTLSHIRTYANTHSRVALSLMCCVCVCDCGWPSQARSRQLAAPAAMQQTAASAVAAWPSAGRTPERQPASCADVASQQPRSACRTAPLTRRSRRGINRRRS
jgi:hypothetical protein